MMPIHFMPLAVLAALLVACCTPAHAQQEWGDLSGMIVLKGEPPQLPKIDPKDDTYCCNADPQNESLVLGEEQGIANVVVYVRPQRGDRIPIHADYAQSAGQPVEFDNKGCAFTPHVALVRTGQPLMLKNTDAVNHNIKGELGDEAFNFMLSAGGTQELAFKVGQRVPRPVACSIHPFMQGWLLVRDDPYMATSDKNGAFVIAKLPAGEHEIQFWHERAGYLKNCRSHSAELDRRGRLTVTIEPDKVADLGTIEVATELMASGGG
jgi:plastocyanin